MLAALLLRQPYRKTQTISKPMAWVGATASIAVLLWLAYRAGSKSRSEKINRESIIKARERRAAGSEVHESMSSASDSTVRDWLKR